MKRRLFVPFLAFVASGKRLFAQNPKVSTYFTPNRVREDWTVTQDGQSFQTTGAGVGSYLEVFRNGILQRLGSDYTTVSIGGAQKVTFLSGSVAGLIPAIGEPITIFYYR